ncbi:MAG: ATP-dependent Clp protease proteolytic subunit, partial [Planctomycetota bacterium]
MLFPRTIELNGKDVLVDDTQMVGYKEHMTQNHRILFLSGIITGEMDSQNLLMALDTLSHDPIRLVITSPGGDLDSAFLFYDTIKLIKSPIETVGRYCASAAAMLLAAG